MGEFKGFSAKNIIDQAEFTNRADQLGNAQLPAEQAAELGGQVLDVLAAVNAGSVEIQPPLTSKQAKNYQTLATTGIAMATTVNTAQEGLFGRESSGTEVKQ